VGVAQQDLDLRTGGVARQVGLGHRRHLHVALERDDLAVLGQRASDVQRGIADRQTDLEHEPGAAGPGEHAQQPGRLARRDRHVVVGGVGFHLDEQRIGRAPQGVEVVAGRSLKDHGRSQSGSWPSGRRLNAPDDCIVSSWG
jgi:hypothetical protein